MSFTTGVEECRHSLAFLKLYCLEGMVTIRGCLMRKHAPARVSYLNGFLTSHRVNMCFPRLMTNMTTPSWIDENACAAYPFGQFSGRPILHRNKWSFRVYIIPLQNFVPEWNSPLCDHTPLVRTARPDRSSLKGAVSWKFTKFEKQEPPQNWVKQKHIRSKC